MAIEQLLAALEADGAAHIEQVTAAARAEAETIVAHATEQAERRRRAALDTRELELRAAAALGLAAARLAARRTVMSARTRLLARVFTRARAALDAVAVSAEYTRQLPAALAAARECFGDEPVEIRCPRSLTKAIRTAVSGLTEGGPGATLTVVTDGAVSAGFIARSADGAVEVDDTLHARLERRSAALSLAALRALESPA